MVVMLCQTLYWQLCRLAMNSTEHLHTAFALVKQAATADTNTPSWASTLGLLAGGGLTSKLVDDGYTYASRAYMGNKKIPWEIGKIKDVPNPLRKGLKSTANNLRKQMAQAGYSIRDSMPLHSSGGITTSQQIGPQGAYVNIRDKVVGLHKNTHPGIIAHELGHIRAPAFLGKMQPIGALGSFGLNIKSLLNTSDRDVAKRDAYLSSAVLGASLLPSEIDASVRGYKLMNSLKNKLPLRHRLMAAIGLPTYIAGSLAPALTYKIREKMNLFNDK